MHAAIISFLTCGLVQPKRRHQQKARAAAVAVSKQRAPAPSPFTKPVRSFSRRVAEFKREEARAAAAKTRPSTNAQTQTSLPTRSQAAQVSPFTNTQLSTRKSTESVSSAQSTVSSTSSHSHSSVASFGSGTTTGAMAPSTAQTKASSTSCTTKSTTSTTTLSNSTSTDNAHAPARRSKPSCSSVSQIALGSARSRPQADASLSSLSSAAFRRARYFTPEGGVTRAFILAMDMPKPAGPMPDDPRYECSTWNSEDFTPPPSPPSVNNLDALYASYGLVRKDIRHYEQPLMNMFHGN